MVRRLCGGMRGLATVRGLDKGKVMRATALGLKQDDPLLFFGHGPVNTTLIAFLSQISKNLTLCSRHAPAMPLALEHGDTTYGSGVSFLRASSRAPNRKK